MLLRLKLRKFSIASIFLFCSCTTISENGPSKNSSEVLLDNSKWRMVNVKTFSEDDLPHKDLASSLEDYIHSITIWTAVINGELMTLNARAGCNRMGRETRKRIITPAKTIEKRQDGKLYYETTPATYETYTEWTTTQKACALHRDFGGQRYETNWIAKMEEFILANVQTSEHLLYDNKLRWVNKDGDTIAEFEKLLAD